METCLITADHGNIENMFDKNTNQPHSFHTLNPVPFVIVKKHIDFSLKNGSLKDIAPTILSLMNIKKPIEMDGEILF